MMTRLPSSPRGFTLIEVLMAAFIIGLGVLGLSALFAGAARQQQIATQTTGSVLATKNAAAILAGNFGAIQSRSDLDINTLSNARPGVWYPVPTPTSESFLSVDAIDDGEVNRTLHYIVREPQRTTLYERPVNQAAVGQGFINANGTVPEPFRTGLRSLPHVRIDPASMPSIDVIFSSTANNRVGYQSYINVPMDSVALYLTDNGFPVPLEWPNVFDQTVRRNHAMFFPSGAVSGSDYIIVRVSETPIINPDPAGIVGMRIAPVISNPTLRIERMELPEYSRRADRLISLDDRIVYRSDAAAKGGQRPDIGYAVLYRRFDSGAAQLGIFTYQLTAQDGRTLRPPTQDRAVFEPQEELGDFNNDRAPLRVITGVQLAYDDIEKNYYILVNADNDNVNWIAEPGQILLVRSRNNDALSGADAPVRVLRRTRVGNQFRGDLDRGPRSAGQSMVPDFNAGTRTDITVWAVQQTATSGSPDAGQWRLAPLDFRVLQVQ